MNFDVRRFVACLIVITTPSLLVAEVAPVAVDIANPEGWVGERIVVRIELRTKGSFAGSAGFDLPEIPRTTVLKLGSPVVSSKELEGESWFIQSHEFAFFSQQSGSILVPEFPVRFSRRDDFTGPVTDVVARCPAFQLTIKRPPGSEDVPFLITTDLLNVTEVWEPDPGSVKFGAILKRTITQEAGQVSGMALKPAPSDAPEGVRVYLDGVATNDRLQRGEFRGERSETITYLMQRSGQITIPEIRYLWWDPKEEKLQSKTLPSVLVNVADKPQSTQDQEAAETRISLLRIAVVILLPIVAGIVFWHRTLLWEQIGKFNSWLNPPERRASRRLRAACRQNNAHMANHAWASLRALRPDMGTTDGQLADAVLDLQRHLFGKSSPDAWDGSDLFKAFEQAHRRLKADTKSADNAHGLPPLNPGSR